MPAKWRLTTGVGLMSLMLLGTGQAWSQMVSITVCNDSSVPADFVFAGRPSPAETRLFTAGWWNVESGACFTPGRFVAAGPVYLYAMWLPNHVEWSGADQKFCVVPNAFFDVATSNCAPNNLKGFTKFQTSGAPLRLPIPTPMP